MSPLHLSDSSQRLNFVSKIQHGSCTHSRWALALPYPQQTPVSLCWDIGTHVQYRVQTLFCTKEIQGLFKGFQGLISHFSRTPFSAKKSLVLPQHEQFYPEGLSVFAPFSLEFYLNYRVSIEIQGLSSTDCNFQGLSRPWMFLLKYCQYTNWVGLSTLWKGSCVKGMCTQYWKSPSLTCFWVLSWLFVCSWVLNNRRYFLRKPVIIHKDFSQAKRVTTWMQIKHKWY